jgi:hypothetical protein
MSSSTARSMMKTQDPCMGLNPSTQSHNTHQRHQASILQVTGTTEVIPSASERAGLLPLGKQAGHSRRDQTGRKRGVSPLDLISLNDKKRNPGRAM